VSGNTDQTHIKSTKVPLTDRQFSAVGKVVAEWALAENVLEHFVWVMIPTDQKTGRAITTHMSAEQRCNLVQILSQEIPPDLQTDAIELVKRFDELRNERNQVAHNVWAGETSDLARGYKASARGTLRLNPTYWTETDIMDLHKDIAEWTVDTINFLAQKLWWPVPERAIFGLFLENAMSRNQQLSEKIEMSPDPHPPFQE
jgi:hypothetical protein